MKGKILDYSIQNSSGIISGDDGNRYEFLNVEWKSDKLPKINQKVDFIIDGNNAKGIYLENSSIQLDTNELKSKLSEIRNSEKVNSVISNGIQNKFGFIVSLIIGISLFFPIIKIPFLGEISLLDTGLGKLIFVLILILSFLFYSGMKRKFVKICALLVFVFMLFVFYDLILDLYQTGNMMNSFSGKQKNSVNLFSLLSLGTYILIPSSFILLFAAFKSKYKEIL